MPWSIAVRNMCRCTDSMSTVAYHHFTLLFYIYLQIIYTKVVINIIYPPSNTLQINKFEKITLFSTSVNNYYLYTKHVFNMYIVFNIFFNMYLSLYLILHVLYITLKYAFLNISIRSFRMLSYYCKHR